MQTVTCLPGHIELDDTLQLSFQSILDHLLDGSPLGRIQRFGLLQLPQDTQVTAFHLTVTGLQESTLQPIRGQNRLSNTTLGEVEHLNPVQPQCDPSVTHLHHQTLLLLRTLPPQFGQLVDLRVQELVLNLISLNVILTIGHNNTVS